jgi:hypothetical protein
MLLSLCLSCGGGQSDKPREINAEGGQAKVLIATRESAFKTELVNMLVADYQHYAHLTVVDLGELRDLPVDDYDALVVMGARMGFLMFSNKERRFLRNLESKDKLILVMTAAVQDWEWDREDIDVISGASRPANLEPVYREISRRLDVILGK